MDIRKVIKNNVILAPLAGYTDAGFRDLAISYGAGLVCTEMVSAKALSLSNAETSQLLFNLDTTVPCAVQLFGHEEEVFRQVVELPIIQKFDVIDINMGCPMPKIIGNGEGSALMENFKVAGKIITAVKQSNKPTSVKFRTGINNGDLAEDFAKMCCDNGVDMITIHGRTQKQLYSGNVDYNAIEKVVKASTVPVFANGDVVNKDSYVKMMERTGCFGVAIGRGAIGKPYIFSEILGLPYDFDIIKAVDRHVNTLEMFLNERVVANEMKKHICQYVKGIKGNKVFVDKLVRLTNIDQMRTLLKEFLVR